MFFRVTVILLVLTQFSFARWGWNSHRFINDAAVDHLPLEMSFFQDHRDYLMEHSVDPDQSSDPNPGYYHYIDIDYYDEFFTGELPHSWQGMIDMYGQETVEDQGVIPWVIQWWIEDLSALMEAGDWNNVWQLAAELGHYVGDSHQAMHLTVNYNGQNSGNYGIHSRYETQMMNPNLGSISLPDSVAGYWTTPIDSIMQYIEEIYPVVDLVLSADDAAYALDSNFGNTYYTSMWSALGDTTIWTLNKAVIDLASLWYTAWVDAGSPYPSGVGIDELELPREMQLLAFPNPFNGQTNFSISGFETFTGLVHIYDLKGSLVNSLEIGAEQQISWDGRNSSGESVHTGVYIARAEFGDDVAIRKLTVLK